MNLRRVHCGMPSNRVGYAFTIDDALHRWTELDKFPDQRSHNYEVAVMVNTNANKIEQSRSILIQAAIDAKADCHVQFDNDQGPMDWQGQLQPFGKVMSYLKEDFNRFDIVVAPAIAIDNTVMLFRSDNNLPPDPPIPEFPADIEAGSPFPIAGGSAGHVFFSRNYLENVKPVFEYRFLNKTTKSTYPLYLFNPPGGDDSSDLFLQARKQGFRIGADARIWDSHWKLMGMSLTMPHGAVTERPPEE